MIGTKQPQSDSVSVIIPVFNRAVSVLRSIDSVFAQTLPVGEIIVIDDGSTDGTPEAIRRHFGSRVRLITQANRGPSGARNVGLRSAQCNWVAFLDSDDIWHPQKLEMQFAALHRFGEEASFCFTNNSFTGASEFAATVFDVADFHPAEQLGMIHDAAQRIAEEREPFFTSSILADRKLLLDAGGFDANVILREDSDLFFRTALRTAFCYVAAPLVVIDRNPERPHGLCELYATRDLRKSASLERVYEKWIALPGIRGTALEAPILLLLERTYWNSFADRLRDRSILTALRKLARLSQLLGGVAPLLSFIWHKLTKRWQYKENNHG